MVQMNLDQFTCPRCGYQRRRPEIFHWDDPPPWVEEQLFAYCPSCRFYGPPASDAGTAAALFIKGAFTCQVRCQDCGIYYPGTFRRTVCIEETVWRIDCCARCYLRDDLWVPKPKQALPDKAYEEFLAEGKRYEDGPFIKVPIEDLRPMEELVEILEAERQQDKVN